MKARPPAKASRADLDGSLRCLPHITYTVHACEVWTGLECMSHARCPGSNRNRQKKGVYLILLVAICLLGTFGTFMRVGIVQTDLA